MSKKSTFKWKVTAVHLQVTQNFYAVQFANFVEHKLATLPKKISFKFRQLGVAQKNFFCLPTGVAFKILSSSMSQFCQRHATALAT
jgi:hypothetical protein